MTDLFGMISVAWAALAVWRFTRLLVYDNGPFHVLDWLRYKAGVKVTYDAQTGSEERYGDTELGELLACPHCVSFWIALALLPYWLLGLPVWLYSTYEVIITLGALWGIATIIIIKVD